MNRNVYAILISVPQSKEYQTETIPDADEAMKCFQDMLGERFSEPPAVVTPIKRPDATQEVVRREFEAMVSRVSEGDLFIVLFIGHGLKTQTHHAYEAWALDDSEFTDKQLVGYLAQLNSEAEVVIISDSCYGAGIATPGPFALRFMLRPISAVFARVRSAFYRLPFMQRYHRIQVPGLARGWSPAALRNAATRDEDVAGLKKLQKLICIAAAAWWDQVDPFVMKEMIDMTISAANANLTHGALADAFDARAATGATFQLIARPNDRMCKPLLALQASTDQPVEEPPMPDAPELLNLTKYVFINNNKKDPSTITFTSEEDPTGTLQEIAPRGGAVLKKGAGANEFILELEAQVIAGFSVRLDVTFTGNAIVPGTSVVTWRGKDPPVPPPPKALQTRYTNTADYEDLFGALLTVGGADPSSPEPGPNGEPARGAGSPPPWPEAR